MKPSILALVLSTVLVTGACTAVPPAAPKRASMVIQVSDNDPSKWTLALNNARNAQADLGRDRVDIEIVAYGPGIAMLKLESTSANRVREALQSGISIIACENTMGAQKLDRQDMLPEIRYVPAGVVQLMQRQQQGWAYIRP